MFLVKTRREGVVELYVLTNSVGEVCAIRRADTRADGWPHLGDLIRAGHLRVIPGRRREPDSYTVTRG